METILDFILQPYFALFMITVLGYLLGRISVYGISLNISGVLFVAMIFGYFGLVFPPIIKQIGLVLFIFTVGFQAGPSFFENFKAEGRKLTIMATTIVLVGAALAVFFAKIFYFDRDLACGLYTGAITSTPGLAALSEITDSQSGPIGYGIAYPFGVIGIVLFIKIFPRIFRLDIKEAESRYNAALEAKHPKVINRNFIVTKEEIVGKTLEEINFMEETGATISRIFHNDQIVIPNADTVLNYGDLIKAVGTESQLESVKNKIGEYTPLGIALNQNYNVRYVIVSNKEVVGKKIHDLHIQHKYNVVITRIRRASIDFSASFDMKIRFGDKLKIVGSNEGVEQVAHIFGDNAKKTYETDYLTISIGIILGVLVGCISIPVGNINISLGLTGGIMAVAIIMSRIHKIGSVIFSVTSAASNIMRRVGLILFLAAVGSDAGSQIVTILKSDGWGIFVSGIFISIVPTIVGVIVAKYFLKIDVLQMLGGIAGGRTSTPGLAAATSMTDTDAPSIAYATVYPIAIVLIIICVQLIYTIL